MRLCFALALLVAASACALAILVLSTAAMVLCLRKRPEPPRWALVRLLLWAGACALFYAGARVGGLPASY